MDKLECGKSYSYKRTISEALELRDKLEAKCGGVYEITQRVERGIYQGDGDKIEVFYDVVPSAGCYEGSTEFTKDEHLDLCKKCAGELERKYPASKFACVSTGLFSGYLKIVKVSRGQQVVPTMHSR